MTANKTTQVYVVDDSKIQLLFLERILKKAGYEVRAFTDGSDMVSLCRKEPPHLIISDIEMPKINGFDLFENLYRGNDMPDVPFFFISSKLDEATQQRVQNCGAHGFFKKPVSSRHLLHSIASILN